MSMFNHLISRSIKPLSPNHYPKKNNHNISQDTQHLDINATPFTPSCNSQKLSTIVEIPDDDQKSTCSTAPSFTVSSSDTSIASQSPPPQYNQPTTPPSPQYNQPTTPPSPQYNHPVTSPMFVIPNITFNQTTSFNHNMPYYHLGFNNFIAIAHPTQLISQQPMIIPNQFFTVPQLTFTSDTMAHNMTTEPQLTFTSNAMQLKANDINPAKKTIFIAKEIIYSINQHCIELFHTDQQNDMGLLFAHVKESNALQINDKQIHIHDTLKGKIIISNIDLHFKDGKIMYLVGMLNDPVFRAKTPWKIVAIMTDDMIYMQFRVTQDRLPKSSRNMRYFIDGLRHSPEYVPESIIWQTNFKKLCKKQSKKKDKSCTTPEVPISQRDLKYYCKQSWYNGKFLPAVVIIKDKQWIEWKKFVRIFNDKHGNEQWVGISLRYHNKKWKIGCMDYDAGRVYYQYRLVGTDNHNYGYSFNDLSQLVNTRLNIY